MKKLASRFRPWMLVAAVLSAGGLYAALRIPAVPAALFVADADNNEQADADLPPRLPGTIDKETYLRLRAEHIGRLRGLEPGFLLDPSRRVEAIQQMETQLAFRPNSPSVVSWTALGPSPLPNGQTQQFPATAPVTGRATAVVVDPTNSNNVYLGTAQGGVWRSTNGGTSWTAIFDTADSLSIGALALAPSDPTKLYVGTGEPNLSGDSFFGVGVYRIDSVNTAPVLVGPINPLITTGSGGGAITTNCFTGRAISRILVHPTDPATIFVSTSTGIGGIGGNALTNLVPPLGLLGVYRSTNATLAAGSVTFEKLVVTTQGSLDSPGTGNTSITDMVLEPGNPNNLLAAVLGAAAPGGGVFRSTNALAATPTFTQTLTPGFTGLVMRLAINKVGSTVTAYVSSNEPSGVPACSSAGQSGRVRKSTDGGVTWGAPLTAAEGYCGGQCFYDNPIAVDPNNASIVYLGGNAEGTCSDVLKRSSDGGTTFTRDDTGLHADSHGFAMDPLTAPTTVWFVNDGGVWKRPDAAAGTAWINANNAPLNTIQFQSVAVHPTDGVLTIGGTQDNGTEAQTPASGTWVSAESGDGGFALIDQSATDTGANIKAMYHTFFNQRNNLIGFDRTELGACLGVKDSWEFRGFGPAPNANPSCDGTAFAASNGIVGSDFVNFYAPMALGPGTPNTLYFGTDKLYRSTNRGDTMTAMSQVISATIPITAIAISPSDDNIRIVGTRNGLVFGTTAGVNPLTSFAFTAPTNATAIATNKYVSRIVIDPLNANTAYLSLAYYTNPSTAGQVWKTTNFNAATPTWTAASSGIPNIPVNALVIDPCATQPNHLWAGTDIGVYETLDGGTTWTPFGTGLPRAAVFDLALQPTSRVLRAATHGRGMWEAILGTTCGAPTPTPTNTPTSTPTNTPTPTPTSTPTATATATFSATPTSTPTNTPTFTPSQTSTNTPTNTATNTPVPATNTPTATPTATATATFSPTPTNSATATSTPTNTPTNTATNTPVPATNTPTITLTPTPSQTSTSTPTNTATNTPVPATNTPTSTPTATATATFSPTFTSSPTPTATPTNTPTLTPSQTSTNTPTNTATNTPVPATNTPTSTPTATATATFSPTFTSSPTPTATPTNTPTLTPSQTSTSSPTNTATNTPVPATNTPTSTRTATATATFSPTPTSTPTNKPTLTPSQTSTNTPTSTATNTPVPPTNTPTATPSPTRTVTSTQTPTITPTRAASATPTKTSISTPTVTRTPTLSPSSTRTVTPSITKTRTATRTQSPTVTRTPSVLHLANIWVGFKSGGGGDDVTASDSASDDGSTQFDLKAEVFKNGVLVGSGQLNNVSGGGLGLNNAILRSIGLAFSSSNITLVSSDKLSIRLSVRISGDDEGPDRRSRQATARLWFNNSRVNSRFDATINGVDSTFYLRDDFLLATSLGVQPKNIDVSARGTFQPFGTWTFTQP